MLKKSIVHLLVVIMTITIALPNAYAKTYKSDGREYGIIPEFTEEKYSQYVKDSLILRIGNTRGFVNGYRSNMDYKFQYVMPYIIEGKTYIPIEFSLGSLGYETEKTDDYSINIKMGDSIISAEADKPLLKDSSAKVEYIHGVLYATAQDISKLTGLNLYDDGTLIILSPNEAVKKPDLKIIGEFKSALEWRASKMYFGDEGFVTGIQIHPKDSDVMYSRTDVGGCYRWEADTETWTQLFGIIPRADYDIVGVRSIALDPNDTNVVYAFAGDSWTAKSSGVLKSTDRGNTWKNILRVEGHGNHVSRTTGEAMAVDPNNSDIIYVGTQKDGLLVSKDGGKSWSKNEALEDGFNEHGINIVMFDERYKDIDGNTAKIYASVAGKGLYISENSGETFKLLEGSPNYPSRLKMVGNTLYVAANARTSLGVPVERGGLWKYVSGKWIEITPPPNSKGDNQQGIGAFIVDYTNTDFIIAMGESWTNNDRARYRSFDSGKTWEYFRTDMGWNVADLVQDPKNPKRALMADGAGIIAMKNIYQTLEDETDRLECEYQERGMEELVCLKVMSIPHKDAPMLLLSCYDRGFMMAEDPYHRGISQVKEQNVDIGWATDWDYCNEDPSFVARLGRSDTANTIALSNDYGRMAKRLDSWDRGKAVISLALSATLQDNGYPVMIAGGANENGISGSLYRSRDWGATWEELDGVKCDASSNRYSKYWKYILVSDTVDGNTFYYCENKDFYVTRDCGDTWTNVFSLNKLDSGFSNPNIVAVPGKEGEVYIQGGSSLWKSKDYGHSWSKVENLVFDERSHFAFGKGKPESDYPALYATAFINGVRGVYISDDMGENFRRIDDDSQSYTIGREDGIAGDMNVYGRVFVSTSNTGVTYYQLSDLDDVAPVIEIDNQSTSDSYGIDYAVTDSELIITGNINERAEVRINNQPVDVTKDLTFTQKVTLAEGENVFRFEAVDANKNKANPIELRVRYIPDFFEIELNNSREILTNENAVEISGITNEPAVIYVNDTIVNTGDNNKFSVTYPLNDEKTQITVYGVTDKGVVSEKTMLNVTKDNTPPVAEFTNLPDKPVEKKNFKIEGRVNEEGQVRINNVDVAVNDDLTFSTYVLVADEQTSFKLQSKDKAGNVNKPQYFTIMRDLSKSIDKTKLNIDYKTEDFVFDGDISDWELKYDMDELYWGETANYSQFALMWDEEYLYAAVKTVDEVVFTQNSNLTECDAIEVYVDGNNTKGTKYDKNCKQYILVAGKTTVNSVSKITDDGYVMEIAIPWSSIGVNVSENKQIGLDINFIDNDNNRSDSGRCGIMGFNGTKNNWLNPSPWTTFTLVKNN